MKACFILKFELISPRATRPRTLTDYLKGFTRVISLNIISSANCLL